MARPEELEEDAVKRACVLAKKANVPLIVCGPTSKEALAVIADERSKGQVKIIHFTSGINFFFFKGY
jgi:dihydroorotase-like cyclic amidohydrolase